MIRTIKRYYRILKSLLGSIQKGFPALSVKLICVTGTSGKSTTSTMIYHILKNNGLSAGLVSTIGAIAGDEKIDTGLHVTTPDPVELQNLLKKMAEKDIKYVVLETSSHALEQGRLGFLRPDFAVFTNIKRDHLDYHKTWENYASDKARLILKLKSSGKAIVNKDEPKVYNFLKDFQSQHNKPEFLTYSAATETNNAKETSTGLEFEYKTQKFFIPILGFYNIENALASIKVAESLGISISEIAKALESFATLPGRMQIMQSSPFSVIVDFAHNTDSLERSLQSARKLVEEGGRLITVFGSAGLRDVEKRFLMGESAGRLADIVVVTAEDPRTESLFAINTSIIKGAESSGGMLVERFKDSREYKKWIEKSHKKETSGYSEIYSFDESNTNSRYNAIEFALKLARPGDVVIAEGKGHEQSLCFGQTEFEFTDQDAVKKALGK